MFERPVSSDLALLVHIDTDDARRRRSGANARAEEPLTPQEHGLRLEASRAEFKELALSAGLKVTGLIVAKRRRPDARLFVGKGKLDEIRDAIEESGAELVLFGQRLAPSQERNLEAELKVRVLDRNSLILDIFAQRARSFDGKLQVELAQLQHLSTRLVRGWTHLERQKGGIGLRGPGETQLETDRRLLNERVKVLKGRLTKVRRQREQGRAQRTKSGIHTVALVGYTNAGKSTLFNQLTDENVYSADQLFATLDPTLRRLDLVAGQAAVMADTVGFIEDLPHELVDAFRSTLTETREADLLVHVVDVVDDEREQRQSEVNHVLKSIGAGDVPQLVVYNKIDLTELSPQVRRGEADKIEAVWVSAVTGAGIEPLKEAIAERLGGSRVTGTLQLSPNRGKLRAQLYAASAVSEEIVADDGTVALKIDVDAVDWAKLVNEHGIDAEFDT